MELSETETQLLECLNSIKLEPDWLHGEDPLVSNNDLFPEMLDLLYQESHVTGLHI